MGRAALSPRLPSLSVALDETLAVARRFPFAVLGALASAVIASFLIRWPAPGPPEWLKAAFFASTLTLPLGVAVVVASERFRAPRVSLALHGAAVFVLLLFAALWPSWQEPIQVRRYVQFSLAAHLLVAFLPYVGVREANGFWHYNRMLFLRFLTSALFSGVLFVGLLIALMALDPLFKVKVAETVFYRLWIWIAFVFNTLFFLGGVPRDLPELETRSDYPTQLKVFAQFILVPLVAVYLAILTAYLGRVLITGQWPKGWIGWLVSSVAAAGILSLLLVHPIRKREENRWVATYARWFYVAMIPSVGMLIAAIWKRIAQYGVTEDRYFIAVLAGWLAVVSVIFIVRRESDIRIIPQTLCALAILTIFGPWSAYDVSFGSQLARTRRLLAAEGRLENGRARASSAVVTWEKRKAISGSLGYLIGNHRNRTARTLLSEIPAAVPSASNRPYRDQEASTAGVMRDLGLDYVAPWEGPTDSPSFSFYDGRGFARVNDVGGARSHVRLSGQVPLTFSIDSTEWRMKLDGRRQVLTMASPTVELEFPLDTTIAIARRHLGTSVDPIRLEAVSGTARAALVLRTLNGVFEDGEARIQAIDADLYLTVPERPAVAR